MTFRTISLNKINLVSQLSECKIRPDELIFTGRNKSVYINKSQITHVVTQATVPLRWAVTTIGTFVMGLLLWGIPFDSVPIMSQVPALEQIGLSLMGIGILGLCILIYIYIALRQLQVTVADGTTITIYDSSATVDDIATHFTTEKSN